MVSCTDITQCIGNFRAELKKRLDEGQAVTDGIEDIEFTSLDVFATSHMWDTFYKNKCSYVKKALSQRIRAQRFTARQQKQKSQFPW